MSNAADLSALILIVDDDENNRVLLATLLESQGYAVAAAATGEVALEVFQRQPVDLILMDVVMPGMGGLDATRSIKLVAGERFVPIIFHSFLDQEEVLADCVAAGGDDFLP